MFNHFTFAKFRFTIQATEEMVLPLYKGAVFRGGFGYTFKKVVCFQRGKKECSECILHNKCVYSYIFETAPPEDTKVLKLYKTVPHPFVIEPPLSDDRVTKKDERISFNLILIGKAVDYLPYFIFTFTELGKQGIGKNRSKFTLEKVESLDINSESKIIYEYDNEMLQNNYSLLEASHLNHTENKKDSSHVELKFLTPFRVRFDGKITDNIEFHVLFRNLLRRVSSLSYFHCGKELECDFKSYIEEAKKIKTVSNDLQWFDWERYSTRQKQRMNLGGVLGTTKFGGNLEPFLQFLRLGEHIHVGKGTSFGLGRYKILN